MGVAYLTIIFSLRIVNEGELNLCATLPCTQQQCFAKGVGGIKREGVVIGVCACCVTAVLAFIDFVLRLVTINL